MRSRFIPPSAVKVIDKLSDAVAYLYERHGQPVGLVYYGKQTKAVAHFRYRADHALDRERMVTRYFAARRARNKMMAERAQERKALVNRYKVGDILNTCWGYDQTNREYYEVTGVKAKMVELTQIECASRAAGDMAEKTAPLAGAFIKDAKPIWRRAGDWVKIDGIRRASLTAFEEPVPGVKVYAEGYVSHYA